MYDVCDVCDGDLALEDLVRSIRESCHGNDPVGALHPIYVNRTGTMA